MKIPEILKVYQDAHQQIYNKSYYPVPKVRMMMEKLQGKLDERGIEAKSYLEISSKLWKDIVPEKGLLPLNVLCSDKCIERYKNLDPLTDDDLIYWIMVHIEYNIAQHTVNREIYGKDWIRYENELEDWISAELSVLGYEDWENMKKEHPMTHRRACAEAMNNIKEMYGISENCYDYNEVATKVYWRRNNG